MEVTRRDLFKLGSIAAVGAIGGSALAGCAPQATSAEASNQSSANDQTPEFLRQPDPITEFSETKEFDVVVIGAGESGLAAVHTALEAGAKVACVQNIGTAQTTGNMGASVDTTKTDEAGVEACVAYLLEKNAYRSNRKLLEAWAKNSYEAITWWADTAARGGAESKPFDSSKEYNGYTFYLHANTYNHLEGAHNDAALAIAEKLASDGAEFFYNSPAVQFYKEGDRVAGAVCETEGGYTLFKASKGVILASGDCSGNEEMRNYYCPDLRGFKTMSTFRDGMGMCAGMWAGAIMTPPTHTKMIHGEPAAVRLEMPFLFIDNHGRRFMDETCCRMGYMNNFARPYLAEKGFQDSTAAKFFSLAPSDWETYYEDWKAEAPYDVSIYNGANKVNPEKWIQGETIEELVEAMNAYAVENQWDIDPLDAKTVAEEVNRYNELCAAGRDEDFGKSAKYLVPIEGGPYYAVPRGSNKLPAILGGLVVNAESQCLDGEFNPIEGLYAVGNASGQFYGGVDYPMDIEGLSIGRAITSGYVTGKLVASL